MASYGHPTRSRPALYKPTDFGSQQKRTLSVSTEPKKEEEKVVKIQQRPPVPTDEKPEQADPSKPLAILKLQPTEKEQMPEASKKSEEKPTGVADKDLDKIQKLKEFMAKQQNGVAAPIDVKEKKSKDVKDTKDGKSDRSRKDTRVGKNGKENKDTKSNRPAYSRNQRNNKQPAKYKPDQSDKPNEKGGKAVGSVGPNQGSKNPTGNAPVLSTGGTRPKTSPVKGLNNNQKSLTEGPKNQNRGQDCSTRNQMGLNSYYSQRNFPGSSEAPWLQMQYAMGGSVVNNPGILGNPYGQEGRHEPSNQRQQPGSRTTIPANRDKYEKQRSLDFVKSFFDNDPEVQYHRKHNAEKKVVVTPDQNTAILQKESSLPSHHVSHPPGFVHHNTHIAAVAAPTSYASIYHSNISHHSNVAPGSLHLSASNALHQGGSPGPFHQGSSPNTLHTVSLPSSLQHHGGFQEMYSQVNPNAGLLSPGSSYAGVFSQNTNLSSGNISSFSNLAGYFPPGSHHSHVQHAQQQIDPAVMANIMQEQIKQKKWQKKALNKCGPIDSTQARSLIEQLIDGSYECMVCCESVKWSDPVWSCTNCFHIFHLTCIRKWARSETAAVKDESGWRCPGCQNVSTRPPNKYFCFCGKVRDPDWNPRDGITPHSCGEVCKKKRINPPCEHSCNELCHPGRCPSCPVMATKHCPCGKTITKTRCGQSKAVKCDNQCSKLLKCGKHHCQMKCHEGPCETCEVKFSEECHCSSERRYVSCGTGEVIPDSQPDLKEKCEKKYSCEQPCERMLECGSHTCEQLCHLGKCKECPLLPHRVQFCPCGKVPVSLLLPENETRKTCLDPIPTCDSFCGKKLHCGPKGSSHLCMMKCHTGNCQPCEKMTSIQCRCGATKKEILCRDLRPGKAILCERKCNKKRKCGRHKCNQKCCTDRDHACNIICGKKLSCNMHKCDEVCHTGFCPPCWRAGFDELSCFCGSTILYPPIACGTKPPDCDQPCSRPHQCGHSPLHTCHSEEACPPCTVLTTKQCMGGHEMWKNVPCHLTEVSCGRKCGKVTPCGYHKCIKTCHKGPCLDPQEICTQPCPVQRRDCSHPCDSPCHAGMDCPSTPCKAQITISCRCGRKSANALCLAGNGNSAYMSFNAEMLTSQLRNLQSGQSIDIASLTNAEKRPKFLECDEECSRLERNKRLAEALGIDNPEGGHFQHTNFSPLLKEEARLQYPFVQMLEVVLENLVLNAKKSSQSQIHHSFPPMNISQRKIIHELADAYGCKTYSQDQEPKRNTVLIATKDSYIPNIKLSTVTERDIMRANPPQPVMIGQDNSGIVLGPSLPLKPILKQPSNQGGAQKVDYFDDPFVE